MIKKITFVTIALLLGGCTQGLKEGMEIEQLSKMTSTRTGQKGDIAYHRRLMEVKQENPKARYAVEQVPVRLYKAGEEVVGAKCKAQVGEFVATFTTPSYLRIPSYGTGGTKIDGPTPPKVTEGDPENTLRVKRTPHTPPLKVSCQHQGYKISEEFTPLVETSKGVNTAAAGIGAISGLLGPIGIIPAIIGGGTLGAATALSQLAYYPPAIIKVD